MNLLSFFSQKKIFPDEKKLGEIVAFVEEREFRSLLPNLAGKSVLEIAPREVPLAGLIQKKGARLVTAVLGGPVGAGFKPAPTSCCVVSHWEALPFLKETWDQAIVRVPFFKGALGRLISEVSRILRPAGGVTLSDLHPFSLKKEQKEQGMRPRDSGEEGGGFERYIRHFHDADLQLESVREVFFDGTLKKFFPSSDGQRAFETLKRSPLLILFQLRKGEG